MRRLINKITNIMILLVILSSIGISSASAGLVQNLELSTHNADGNNYADAIATTNGDGKIKFVVDDSYPSPDWTIVSGTSTKTSRYYGPFTVGSTHSICVINTVDNADKICKSITIPSLTKELTVTKMDIKHSDTGYITVTIFYTGKGIIAVDYDNMIDQITVDKPDSYTIKTLTTPITTPGTYDICAYNANNHDSDEVCKSLEISDPYTIEITNLIINNTGIIGEGQIIVKVTSLGYGTLGIDIDNVLVWSKVVTTENSNVKTQFNTTPGNRTICVYDYINKYNPTNICRDIDVLSLPTKEDDEEDPVILSVNLEPSTPSVGELITVIVNAIDNIKVTSVTANENSMTFYDKTDVDSYWKSTIVSIKGTNAVSIEAKDANGNNAKKVVTYTSQENIKLSSEKTDYKSGKGLIPMNTPTKLKFGVLFVDSIPPNASIIINDKEYGLTPKALDISTGGYEVKLSKYGYNDYIKKIIVSEFETAEIIANMTVLTSNSTTKKTSGTNTDVSLSGENDVVINEKESSVPTNNKDDKILGTIVLVISCILIGGIFIYKYFSSFNQEDTTNGEIKKENDIIVKIKKFLKKCKESFKK